MTMPFIVLSTLLVYLLSLVVISQIVARRSRNRGNDAFFTARHRAPWQLVALGMIAGSMSGVSLVSVPAWVGSTQMSYLQMCLGYVPGYIIVAFVLLPLYYRLRLTSIYSYLSQRFGRSSQHTGAWFFIFSKLVGSAARLYLATLVLHNFVAAPFGIPFLATAVITILLIWLYTQATGQAALIYTDVVQTLCMLFALVATIIVVLTQLKLGFSDALHLISESPLSKIFVWDAHSPQNFWRQLISGVFIVIVMTGLDQDMMQKNLTCRTLRDAQKDMCIYGMAFLPINALLLGLGVLIYDFCAHQGIVIPAKPDQLLPQLVMSGALGKWVLLPFALGIVAAAFSAADGAMASITTSLCVDIAQRPDSPRLRRWLHVAVAASFLLCVLAYDAISSRSVIDTIYRLASYTYGPLLGLYAFGLFTSFQPRKKLLPVVCILSPILCAVADHLAPQLINYKFGYELLLFNGMLTALGLWLISWGRSPLSSNQPLTSQRR